MSRKNRRFGKVHRRRCYDYDEWMRGFCQRHGLTFMYRVNGRVVLTESGRMRSSRPNLQDLTPKYGPKFEFPNVDYAKLEARAHGMNGDDILEAIAKQVKLTNKP